MGDKKKTTLGLIITDGVGFRNFILSDFLPEAEKKYNKIVIYSALPSSVYKEIRIENIEINELPVFQEPFKTWCWRKAKEVAHLRLHKDFYGINDNYLANRSTGKSIRGKVIRLIYRITQKFHSEAFIKYLEKQQLRSVGKHPVTIRCIEFLKKDKPDLLFFTHQRPPYVVPMVFAAKKMEIKTNTFIFSWDNLASKGRMAANFTSYLVWSDLMKEELLYFYPGIKKEKIQVVGTPQFEPYIMPEYEKDSSSFFKKFELDPTRKTICYSCGDISTSKNDELYIGIIAGAIQNRKVLHSVNFLVRTSPAEEPDRFHDLKRKYPFIKWNFPDWYLSREDHPEAWSQRVPSKEDLKDLRSILNYCDLSINMCSTMSLDFMIFHKPVINPVFGNEGNGLYNDQRFLKFGHYKRVVDSGAVKIAKNEQQLIEAINFYLQHPEADTEERKELVRVQTGKPLEGTSKRIAMALTDFY